MERVTDKYVIRILNMLEYFKVLILLMCSPSHGGPCCLFSLRFAPDINTLQRQSQHLQDTQPCSSKCSEEGFFCRCSRQEEHELSSSARTRLVSLQMVICFCLHGEIHVGLTPDLSCSLWYRKSLF